MMKFWEDWKEKLKKFLKADVLAECRQQVDHENRVVLCVLNSSMVCLSFMLAFYILWRKQAEYYHEHMCILYAALFLILLFVSFYSKRDSGIRLSVLIAVEYVAIGSCFAMNHIIFGGRESTTAYYLLVGLAFCFLVRPIQMYLMQAGITCILAVSMRLIHRLNRINMKVSCNADRVETPEEKKRLSEAMELSNIREHLKSQDVYIVEVPLRSKNGKYRQKQIRCMYLNQQTGTLLLMLSDVEDIVKEEKEKQEQLEKALKMAEAANEAKTKFLAGMSHEIRTPMNAIIGLNSMIRSSLDDREQVLDYTEKLDSASQYLLALLNDILDMSRIESGSMKLAIRAFEGDKFWDNVNMLAKAQAVMAGVGYSFERRKKISEVYIGDSTRLEQIMVNLINNAVKFTPKGGNVNVSVAEQETDGRVQLTAVVSDNGIGIAKDFLPKVFEIFTQEHEENTRVYGGSGLGLSIARNYARMMDGDITVESAEGKGTVFTVTAKLDFDRRKKARKERTENISFEGKRILLVEDHPLNVIVAKGLLEKKQFEVVTAENGKKAVELVTDAPEYYFDAILMDIRMPVLDGIEAARQIRALDRADVKELPIIAMTANAGDEDRRQTKEAGMNEHLAKPIDPKLLYTTLQKFILP